MGDYDSKPSRGKQPYPLSKERTTVPKGATTVPKPFGDITPERMPKRVEGMETPDEPAAGHEPGGTIVSDAQKRALAPIRGLNNGLGTSTDLQALGYSIDSTGRWTGEGNLGKVETSNEMHQYMASNRDKLSQAAISASKSRLGRKALQSKSLGE